mmetsp:Transcript_5880/g.9770  ORF Transcript_5880/g.9770 Transcript_5880/m.9770 type:complete len:346 (+) Transcript_5880:117-1154(+)|eukprot:CAMPEP_0119017748 /NCGR_PEP_ID=MMETSP1176-20130426/17558_1 /TAXON_ID=265551 /ORGANISM="Synedropsis recta cf, Strain CCMP1620" /LENGTH=345 /DNA_ID=CAMNT_0006971565 /DNA_START=29 /DNA_END=1066 /DNA_ORIENTATION=+
MWRFRYQDQIPSKHDKFISHQRRPRSQMEAPVFDRGETAEISIVFDGSAPLHPGPAGYGGVININGHVFNVTGRLGDTTKEVAEYMGLIGCMRGVIRTLKVQGWRHYYSSLVVLSDSGVIDHLLGECEVGDPRLRLLHNIVRSLEREFNFVSYTKMGHQENIEAHQLASQGRKAFSRTSLAVYHPNLKGMVDVWIEGVRTIGTNDMDSTGKDPSFMIDSRFLKSIPGGKTLLRNMQDPYPLSMIRGKTNMTVLGTIQLHVGVRCFGTPLLYKPLCGPDTEGLVTFVVVQELPCPVHVSWKNQTFPMNTESRDAQKLVPFHPDELPEMYGDHKYWAVDLLFIGNEL